MGIFNRTLSRAKAARKSKRSCMAPEGIRTVSAIHPHFFFIDRFFSDVGTVNNICNENARFSEQEKESFAEWYTAFEKARLEQSRKGLRR